jgi:hypothetical protein
VVRQSELLQDLACQTGMMLPVAVLAYFKVAIWMGSVPLQRLHAGGATSCMLSERSAWLLMLSPADGCYVVPETGMCARTCTACRRAATGWWLSCRPAAGAGKEGGCRPSAASSSALQALMSLSCKQPNRWSLYCYYPATTQLWHPPTATVDVVTRCRCSPLL